MYAEFVDAHAEVPISAIEEVNEVGFLKMPNNSSTRSEVTLPKVVVDNNLKTSLLELDNLDPFSSVGTPAYNAVPFSSGNDIDLLS
jgi:hypothetical protein